MTEILGKTLREEEENEPLFRFIEQSVVYLDEAETGFENFHIQFLLQLAAFLGFGIENLEDLEGELKNHHFPHTADNTELIATEHLLLHNYGVSVSLDRTRRVFILEKLLFFYKIHMDSFGEIRSLEVLKEVMN